MSDIEYTDAKSLRDVTVGDYVFVVYQRTEGQIRRNDPKLCYPAKIVKKGRKYYYIEGTAYYWEPELPFDPDTGESHHKTWKTRSNGYGFDVYLSPAHYHQSETEIEEFKRLKSRIHRNSYGELIDIDHDLVMAIHSILDTNESRKQ